ncbi:APC family permease [Actinomadura madurae]|uniref:APC family permease n=1 Tax=Actinomadura madurae TaxID=1993 RepID=UPI00202649DA|nr:APC family permease [Actinomadura madurae]MCQ0020902.1 APC family permease [Actinomadura madurae]URN00918.1 APC family permease [Actinomadura madurae]
MTQHTPNTRATAQESRPAVGLDQAALGTPEVVFQAISHLGPAIGVIIVAPVIAGLVGASMPLLMLLAMAAVLLTGAGVAMLAAKLPSAGGYYSYVSHGLGKRSGFVTSWAYFLYDPLIPTLLILITSGILQPAIKSGWGIDIPWWLIMTVLMTLVYVMTLRGVKLSANVTMALGAAECVIMVVFGIWTMIHTGGAAFAAGPFEWPDTGGDLHPVFLAFAFGVLLFTGFESAAPLAEETRDPRRAIPRTVLVSIVVVGLVWAFSGYSAVVGWEGDIAAMGTGDNPFFVIADDLAGWAWIVLALALLNSAIAGALAGQNAGARVLYALGRANVLPAALGRVHRTYRTPALALTLIYVLNLALSFALGGWLGPVAAFSFIGLFVTLGVIVLYVMGNIAVVRLFRTRFRAEFNPLKHVLVPLLASAVLVVGLYYSLVPWPDWPLNLAVIIVACWLCLGVLLAFALGKTRRDALDRAAQLMFSDDTAEADDPGARA